MILEFHNSHMHLSCVFQSPKFNIILQAPVSSNIPVKCNWFTLILPEMIALTLHNSHNLVNRNLFELSFSISKNCTIIIFLNLTDHISDFFFSVLIHSSKSGPMCTFYCHVVIVSVKLVETLNHCVAILYSNLLL